MTDADDRPRMWLVRHGETEWARLGKHTGRTDIPLTELGRAQAGAVARRLAAHSFEQVISSPLSRALDTARLAGFGDRVRTDVDLLEWDYGRDEGRTTAEIGLDRPGWTIWTGGPEAGETIDEVAARVDRVIARARA
ncbi:MAG: histidine phosphatase family protein, partial [Chloroflexota bacterium]